MLWPPHPDAVGAGACKQASLAAGDTAACAGVHRTERKLRPAKAGNGGGNEVLTGTPCPHKSDAARASQAGAPPSA
eukprot:CAMPEP_0204599370 /NCGR_PEP_ID=MMETSP0661-20131031/54787_1 /ASSEMBLY_ACC=CAM_ASM_000606 /TAXON_ID=109239 /ORGANISM="Alexandrium margalefi, Strain AMGDE01CS-322" /LENGTH=75 /DNA_ID=CAMNT_0051610087 /DNA_START=177 /DNA_END=404 /DNA_ORIENTATION=-